MPVNQQTVPAIHHASKLISDPDEFNDALSGTTLKVELLTAQRAPAHVERFQSVNWTLDMGAIHAKARALADLPNGWGSLGFMWGSGTSIWHGLECEPGSLVCNPPGGDGPDGIVTPGFAWTAIGIPASLWQRCRVLGGANIAAAGRLKIWRWQMPKPLFAALGQQLRETRQLLHSALTSPELTRSAERAASALVTSFATHAWESAAPDHHMPLAVRNRARLARRAETWIRDRLDEPIRVPDVCLALKVSRRELEYAFRDTFDASPQEFLNKLRLNAIHRALLHSKPKTSITSVAFDHGVFHLGRFAAAYFRLFGEKPSDTLRERPLPSHPTR